MADKTGRVNASVSRATLDWLHKKVEDGTFRNTSHAVEFALKRLMDDPNYG